MAARKKTEPGHTGLKMLSIYVDEETVNKVKAHAEEEGRKIAQMGRRLIEEALEAREHQLAK